MYNKILRIVLSLIVSILLSGTTSLNVQAQARAVDSFTFSQVGESEIQLRGSFDSRTFVFGLPSEWEPSGDAKLDLNLGVIFNANSVAGASSGGTLTVTLNRVIIGVLQINELGEINRQITIPATAFTSIRADGRMELGLMLDSGIDCKLATSQNFSVIIHNSSRFTIPHKDVVPDINLAKFPRPLYQDSFNIDSALVVTPDQPSAQELQSAMTVAAGLGNLTSHRFNMELTTIGQLTTEQKSATNLILVGKSAALPVLSALNLPLTIAGGGLQLEAGGEDNGVVVMVNSPWALAKVVLVVTGNTDIGVVKAAQAVTTGVLQPNSVPNLAVVKEVQPELLKNSTALDQTLADLGYDIVKLDRVGVNTASYIFTIPPGQTVTSDAFFDLVLRHTALLDFAQSGLVVSLNGQPIGSSGLTADKATLDSNHYQIMIPPSLVLTGRNQLDVSVELRPVFNCSTPNFDDIYAIIWPESSLHLPLQPSHIELAPSFSLDIFPAPFTFDSALSNVAFVFPRNNLVSWNSGLQIASLLGDRANGTLTALHAFYADDISDEDLSKYSLLIVGQPSQLKVVGSLNASLPMPVREGSDVIQESKMQVLFSISPELPMGYVELLPSPWSQGNNILTVFGNTSQGVIWASNTLVDPTLRSRLSGNFATITDQQVVAVDTRLSALPNIVVSNTPTVAGTQSAPSADFPSPIRRPIWILMASIGTAGLAFLILFIAIFRGWLNSRKKNSRPEKEA